MLMAYFQATMQRELEELDGMRRVDNIVMWGTYFDHLLHILDAVLGPSELVGLYPNAQKYMLCDTSFKWYGKTHFGGMMKYHLERVSGLANMW